MEVRGKGQIEARQTFFETGIAMVCLRGSYFGITGIRDKSRVKSGFFVWVDEGTFLIRDSQGTDFIRSRYQVDEDIVGDDGLGSLRP